MTYRSSGYSSDYFPKTPKFSSVALPLPNSPTIDRSFWSRARPMVDTVMNQRPLMPPIPGQSTTHHQSSGRRHTIPQENYQARHQRQRTLSNTSAANRPLKSILKNQHAAEHIMPTPNLAPIPTPSRPPSRSFFKPLKSILKTSKRPMSVAPEPVTSAPPPRADLYYSDTEHTLKSSEATRRSSTRTASKGDQRGTRTRRASEIPPAGINRAKSEQEIPIDDLKKPANTRYKCFDGEAPIVEKVRLKPSVVSLNWILLCQDTLKKQRPSQFSHLIRVYDMAFQPDAHPNDWSRRYQPGARVWNTVSQHYLTDDEARGLFVLPTSSHCKIKDMRIVMSSNPNWHCDVHASKGIRCIDVFRALFDMLQQHLNPGELKIVGGGIRYCEMAREERIKVSPVIPEIERRLPCRRIDTIGNYRFFHSMKQQDNDTWTLETCNHEGKLLPSPPS